MTVYDFIALCTEDSIVHIEIYDLNSGDVVFSGDGADAKFCDYAEHEVLSFDAPEKPWSITVNIEV